MRGQFRKGWDGRDTKGRVCAAIRVAWIKEKFSAAEIAHTHARRLTQWRPPCPWAGFSFYDGNRTYTYSLRNTGGGNTAAGVRRCCANLQIFRRCKPSPRYYAKLQIFCIVTAWHFYANLRIFVHCSCINIRDVFIRNAVSIGLLDNMCLYDFRVTLICAREKEIDFQLNRMSTGLYRPSDWLMCGRLNFRYAYFSRNSSVIDVTVRYYYFIIATKGKTRQWRKGEKKQDYSLPNKSNRYIWKKKSYFTWATCLIHGWKYQVADWIRS